MNFFGTLLYQSIQFLLTPILTRALGEYDFGIVTLYTSWVNLLIPFVSLSLLSAISVIAVHIDPEKQKHYISSLLGLFLLWFLLFASVVLIFSNAICRFTEFSFPVLCFMLAQCFGMSLVNFIVAYFVQYQQTIFQFVFTITISLVTFSLTILLLRFITDETQRYLCRIAGYSVPYFIAGLIVLTIFIFKDRHFFSVEVWKFALPLCVPIIFHSASHIVISQSGKIVLQKTLENGTVLSGQFGFVYQMASLMQVVWTALNNAWVPYYFSLQKNEKYDDLMYSARRYRMIYCIIFAAFVLVSPEFALIMGGEKYEAYSQYIPIISLGIFFMFMYSFPVNYKTYLRKTKSIAFCTLLSAICGLILCFVLIPEFKLWGASIAVLIAYALLFLFHNFSVKKVDRENYGFTWRFFGITFIMALIPCIASFLLIDLWIIRWAIAVILGCYMLWDIIKKKRIF